MTDEDVGQVFCTFKLKLLDPLSTIQVYQLSFDLDKRFDAIKVKINSFETLLMILPTSRFVGLAQMAKKTPNPLASRSKTRSKSSKFLASL